MANHISSQGARRLRLNSPVPKEVQTPGANIREMPSEIRIRDPELAQNWIEERHCLGIDQFDEVWEGVYVVPPMANNPHQGLVGAFTTIFHQVIDLPGRGRVFPGANVSDRREGWEQNYRVPDVVVILKKGRAEDCGTHWLGGPDFLVEIESPREDTEAKIPFYSHIHVQELLVVHRDTRTLRLYHHDGQALILAGQSDKTNKKWLESEVLPLSFRWNASRVGPCTEIKCRDEKRKTWKV